ncbi:phage antirepressor KilAC domain-containing protein [[Clostridium] innocuum]|nr:phage antirepressor KilAC domain-containing protein [[Clostridium] innocuum]
MEGLVKVTYNDDRITVSARDLHEFLGIKTDFRHWFPRMCEYGFEENVDYILLSGQKRPTNNPKNPITVVDDYQITIDMGKEISMLQRNEKGKQARKYFIECEKKLKNKPLYNIPQTYADALRLAAEQYEQIEALQLEKKGKDEVIVKLKPKADYCDQILQTKDCMLITQIAKDYGYTPHFMNKHLHDLGVQYKVGKQWVLYSKHADKGYVESDTTYKEDRYGISHAYVNTKWTQKGRLFIYELLKENGILPLVER